MKILKYAAIALGGLALLIVAVLAYVAATFDPNQYKPEIVRAVKDRTQRTLRLEGDLELAIFPSIGVRLGKAALSERASDQEFAAVQDLRIAVKLLPLLSREVVVDAVEVKGLRARVVRFKDGRTNVDDLAGAPAAGPAPAPQPEPGRVKVDIARVRIEDAAIAYVDQAAGTKYELARVNLKTGRIAGGVPTDIDVSLTARADKPKLDVEMALKTRLTFDAEKQYFQLEGLDLTANGAAVGMSGLAASAKGNFAVRAATRELHASGLAVLAKGKKGGGDFNFKLDAPRLDVTRDKVTGDKVMVEAVLNEAKRRLAAKAEVPAIEGTAQAFTAAHLSVNLEMQEAGAKTSMKLTSPVRGSVERQVVELPKLVATVTMIDPGLPKSPIEATVNGALVVDAAKQSASLSFATRFDESAISGRAGLTRFAPPAYTFDVTVDKLDADRYLAKGEKPKADPKAKTPEQPIDLTALKDLNAAGSVKVGSLKAADVKATNVRFDVRAEKGRLEVNPLSASLYQGTLAGGLSVDAASTPAFAIRQKLSGVSVGPLLRDLADNDMLEGRGNVALDITARGNTVSALKKALNGTAAVQLRDGAVKGINIAGSIRSAKARLGTLRGEQVQPADKAEKTDFSELSATFKIKNGVAHNDDLSIKSPLIRVAGAGSVNIGEDTLDYVVKASIVGTTKGQGGRELADLHGVTIPVRVTGALDAPSYQLDFAGLVTDAAKQKVEQTLREQIEKRLGGGKEEKPGGTLQDRLKGLFGR